MKFEANVVYPDGATREVKNLGYMLRNWKEIEAIQVTTFEPDALEGRTFCDAFMSVDFTDGRIYTTGFMSREVLARFLDRPVLRGLPVNWFGHECKIGYCELD
jgi:hypothetical protein